MCAIDGIDRLYEGPYFHEVALRVDRPVAPVLEALAKQDILGGYDLTDHVGTDALLVCATETKAAADIERYATNMARIIGKYFRPAPSALKPEPKTT